MAIQPMALGIETPQINALSAFAQGQQQAQQSQANNLEFAKQNFAYLAQMAHDAQGDPAAWDRGVDALEQSGFPADVMAKFRGRADLAPMLARSAMTATEQLSQKNSDRTYELAVRRFEQEMAQAVAAPKPTAAQQNWDWAGDDPSKQQYLGIGQAAGARPVTADERAAWGIPETDTGAYSIEPGKPPQRVGGAPQAAAGFNVSQATAAGYADRMTQADALLSKPELATVQTDMVERGKAGIPFGIGNMMTSPEFQQADQAQRDFINAILRRESGAVISDNEFASARQQYFPQPGDSEQVLVQKAANRKNAINGVARAAGPAYEAPETTNYLTGAPAPAGGSGAGWEVLGVED